MFCPRPLTHSRAMTASFSFFPSCTERIWIKSIQYQAHWNWRRRVSKEKWGCYTGHEDSPIGLVRSQRRSQLARTAQKGGTGNGDCMRGWVNWNSAKKQSKKKSEGSSNLDEGISGDGGGAVVRFSPILMNGPDGLEMKARLALRVAPP